MANPYAIRHLQLTSGERAVLLMDVGSGIPLFNPTVYTTRVLRAKTSADATVAAHLRAIMIFEIACRIRGIDLEKNINAGRVLKVEDVEDIIVKCRMPLPHVVRLLDEKAAGPSAKPVSKVILLESVRRKQKHADWKEVTNYPARVIYIRDYVNDLVQRALQRLPENSNRYLRLNQERLIVYDTFCSRKPPRHNATPKVMSLTDEQINKLWTVLDPEAKDNPFKNKFVRFRNSLLITMMIFLAPRRGEALGLHLQDIRWSDGAVAVVRRQDDKNEKRRREPKQKTRERHIPASAELLMAIAEYVQDPELRPKYAKQGNTALMVARNGDPLTESGVQKIFERIRKKFPEFPADMSSHICRHTANYILTKAFDAQGLSEAERAVLQREFNGWSETSNMPARYNRRAIEEKTRVSVLRSQEDFSRRVPKRGSSETTEVEWS